LRKVAQSSQLANFRVGRVDGNWTTRGYANWRTGQLAEV